MPEIVAFSLIVILLLGGYWSFVILPKQRAFKKHNQYVQTLGVGDEVITYGGIIGTITGMDTQSGIAYVKIAENVEVKILTAALSRPYDAEDVALNAQVGVDPAAEAKLRSRV